MVYHGFSRRLRWILSCIGLFVFGSSSIIRLRLLGLRWIVLGRWIRGIGLRFCMLALFLIPWIHGSFISCRLKGSNDGFYPVSWMLALCILLRIHTRVLIYHSHSLVIFWTLLQELTHRDFFYLLKYSVMSWGILLTHC